MNRHFEYIDADGKRHAAAQEVATLPRESIDAVIRSANRLLANQARAGGWKAFPGEIRDGHPVYIHIWHPEFPASERMKRINLVQNKNGNHPLYSNEDIAKADDPGRNILLAMHDKDGNEIPSMVVNPIGKTSVPSLQLENAGAISTRTIVIQDMGNDATVGEPSADPQAVTTATAGNVNPATGVAGPAQKPAPIEAR